MQFRIFEKTFSKHLPFSTDQIRLFDQNFALQQLYMREKKGRIIHLSRKWRAFKDISKIDGYQMVVSNMLYEPSYLSLEWALRFYNLIPEWVFTLTACSSKKTQTFTNELWTFTYNSISPRLFFWYNLISRGKYKSLRVASPEKTLCDYLYFHPEITDEIDFEEMRLNVFIWNEIGNKEILTKYAQHYPKRIQNSVSNFLSFTATLC